MGGINHISILYSYYCKNSAIFFFLLLGKEGFKIEVVNVLGTLGTKLKEKILQNWR